MALPNAYARHLSEFGIDLQEAFGIADVAMDREATLRAIAILAEEGATILGGDVYLDSGMGLRFAMANWYTEGQPGESDQSLAARSVSDSRNYVSGFEASTSETAYFSLVIRQD